MMLAGAITAIAIVIGALALLFGFRLVVDLLRGDDLEDAAESAAGGTAAYVGAVGGLIGMGLIQFADALDVILGGIATAPTAVTGMAAAVAGWLGLTGLVDISPGGFVLLVIVVTGGIVVIRRARE